VIKRVFSQKLKLIVFYININNIKIGLETLEKEKRKSIGESINESILGNDFSTKLKLNLNAKPIHFLKNKIVQYEENDTNDQSNFNKNLIVIIFILFY